MLMLFRKNGDKLCFNAEQHNLMIYHSKLNTGSQTPRARSQNQLSAVKSTGNICTVKTRVCASHFYHDKLKHEFNTQSVDSNVSIFPKFISLL